MTSGDGPDGTDEPDGADVARDRDESVAELPSERAATAGDVTGARSHPASDGAERSPGSGLARLERFVLPIAILVLAVPFVFAVIGAHSPRWYPVLDLTMTEVRVRDVFSTEIPTVGLPGRIGELPDQGSHPGPLSFYSLAPVYKLFGSTPWALQVAAAALNFVAGAVALWIAKRRGGAPMVGVFLAVLAVMLHGWGMESLVEPWNPLMPLLWFTVLALATWSVLCRDVKMLPVAVFAASFCAQTHIPYLVLSLAMGALCVVGVVIAWRASGTAAVGGDDGLSDERRGVARWTIGSAVLGVVLWLPPVLQQLFGESGNLAMLVEHFASDPPEAKLGLATGAEWLLVNLNPIGLVSTADTTLGGPFLDVAFDPTASALPGAVLVAVWLGGVVVAWRTRHRSLLALDAVIATGLLVGVFSLANVFGKQWYYLTLWSWTLVCLMVVTIAWTAFGLVRRTLPAGRSRHLARQVGAVGFAAGVVVALVVAVDSLDDVRPDPVLSDVLAAVIPETATALEAGEGGATGTDGRYLVTWQDAYYFGSQGFAVVAELERLGFDVGADPYWRVPMTSHRVITSDEATLQIRLVTGRYIDEVAVLPGAVEIAHYDPRTTEGRARFDELRDELVAEIEASGLDDGCDPSGEPRCLVPTIDDNLFLVATDPRLPPSIERLAFELLELGQPTSVFLLPPATP